jgi:hypothetical protein
MRIVFCRKRVAVSMMRPAKWVLSSTLTAALTAYGLDCVGMVTPEQAMQCCNTMRCHTHHRRSHHGSQDCCSTTPQMHAALGQPSSTQGITFSPVAPGVVQAFSDFQIVEFSSAVIVAHSHDPPASCYRPILSLRI